MDKNDPLNPDNLEPSISDVVYNSTKAALGTIPFFGSILSESLGFGLKSPLQKRTMEYLLALKQRIDTLQLSIEDLTKDQKFVDILLTSYQIAIKNSQEEKIKALQNTVLNTAMKIDIEHDEKIMFLNTLDNLTATHLKILVRWYDSEPFLREVIHDKLTNKKEGEIVNIELPSDFGKYLGIDTTFFNIILRDLETWNLLQNTQNNTTTGTLFSQDEVEANVRSLLGFVIGKNTSFGKKFIGFITDPY